MSPFRMAWLNLLRRPLATWIAVIGIAVAVAASGILLKIYTLSQSRFTSLAEEGQEVVGAKASGLDILLGSLNLEGDYPGFIPYNLFATVHNQVPIRFEDGAVAAPQALRAVIPFLYFANYQDYRVIGTSGDFFKRPNPVDSPIFASGHWPEDSVSGKPWVVAGAEVASGSRLDVGSEVRVHNAIGSYPEGYALQVVGVLKPTGKVWDYALFTSITEAQEHLKKVDLRDRSIWGTNVLNYFLIYHDPGAEAPLRSLIDQRSIGQMITINREVDHLRQLTGTGRNFGLLLTGLILLLAGGSVASMMLARFEAMASQLAILRAIGFERKHIAAWLLWEGALIGALAVVIGACFDIAIFPAIRSASGLNLPAYVPNPTLKPVAVWVAALAVTMCAVGLPLIRLYRQDVNSALKA